METDVRDTHMERKPERAESSQLQTRRSSVTRLMAGEGDARKRVCSPRKCRLESKRDIQHLVGDRRAETGGRE